MEKETYNYLKDKLKVKYIIHYINFLSMTPINKDLKKDITTFVFTWNAYKLHCPYDWENNRLPFDNITNIVKIYEGPYRKNRKGVNASTSTEEMIWLFNEIEDLCKQKQKNLVYDNRKKIFKNILGISIGKSKNKEIHNFHIERRLIKRWYIPSFCPQTLRDIDTVLLKTGGVDINNLIMKFLLRFRSTERLIFLKDCNLLKV